MLTETLADGHKVAPASGAFTPEDHLVGKFKQAVDEERSTRFIHPVAGELVLVPARGVFIGCIKAWKPLVGEQRVSVEEIALSAREEVALADVPRGGSLEALLWVGGAEASNGRLPASLSRLDVFGLRYWPNLTRLPVTFDEIRLAALMARHPTSIAVAAGHLRVPVATVNRFISAAWCAGVAHAVNRRITPAPEHKPVQRGGLLSALLDKLRKSSGGM